MQRADQHPFLFAGVLPVDVDIHGDEDILFTVGRFPIVQTDAVGKMFELWIHLHTAGKWK